MKKSNLMPSIVLGCICLVAALLLSVVNKFTAPLIAKHQSEAASGAFAEILPGATGQQELVIDGSYPSVVTAGYKFDNGYVFQMEVTGYQPGLIILCGIDLDGKITGVKHIQTKETYGVESELNGAYVGDTLDSIEKVLTASPTAPLTSGAYYEAVKAALQAYAIAKGETVDTRTEEEKFQDNCNAALGTTDKTFTKWFATEIITGVDAVYECSDGKVYIIDESFIGIKNGAITVTSTASDTDKATAKAADDIISAGGTPTDVTASITGSAANYITKALVTNSGNYIFEVKGEGYKFSSNYEYAGIESGYIEIKVCISADGKIIDVKTVSHQESKGYGDKCATEEYYDSFRGASNSDVIISAPVPDFHDNLIPDNATGVGIIANSTFTTVGYQYAIKLAFEAFELLTA